MVCVETFPSGFSATTGEEENACDVVTCWSGVLLEGCWSGVHEKGPSSGQKLWGG